MSGWIQHVVMTMRHSISKGNKKLYCFFVICLTCYGLNRNTSKERLITYYVCDLKYSQIIQLLQFTRSVAKHVALKVTDNSNYVSNSQNSMEFLIFNSCLAITGDFCNGFFPKKQVS